MKNNFICYEQSHQIEHENIIYVKPRTIQLKTKLIITISSETTRI